MTTFVAVYRGESVATARLLAVSSDPCLVSRFVDELEDQDEEERERHAQLRVIAGREDEQ